MADLDGKVVIVTGGGRGIGRGIALGVAEAGAKVVVADWGASLHGEAPDERVAQAVADEIAAAGGQALPIGADVAAMAGARSIVDAAVERWGGVDGLVCCAGILRHKPFLDLTEADFDGVVNTHLKGHFAMFQATLRTMVALRRGGSLIGISSGYGQGDPSRAPYRAAKAGIIALTKSVALAGAPYGVRANVISPIANTRMTQASNLHFNSEPKDIAPMALFLLSDLSAGVTGDVFGVHGDSISSWNDPQERRTARNAEGWTAAEIAGVAAWLREGGGAAQAPPPALPRPDPGPDSAA